MYRRYQPGSGMHQLKQGKPTAGEMEKIQKQPHRQGRAPQYNPPVKQNPPVASKSSRDEKQGQSRKHPILGILPPAVYNPDTKKILGMFSAEDLLLIALIFLLLDSKESEDSTLVYLLLYILISDYIDLPF